MYKTYAGLSICIDVTFLISRSEDRKKFNNNVKIVDNLQLLKIKYHMYLFKRNQ